MDSSANMIQVACPMCRGPLSAPAHFAGATVQCPRCQSQLVLPLAAAPTAPPVVTTPTPASSPRRVDDLLPPTTAAPVPAASSGRATFKGDATKGASIAAVAAETTGSDVELTARFRRTPAATPAAPLAKLPSLQLASTVEKSPRNKGAAMRGPWLAIALVCSVLASAALLFIEPPSGERITPGDRHAWEQLESTYFGDGTALQPYQRLLRQAQQAQHRGEQKQRDALLRQVLDLLRAERPNPAFGITGYQTPAPPNDQHLEETIMTLLRER